MTVRAPEPLFDQTMPLLPDGAAAGLPDPLVYDGSARALRQRTVNFAAKRMADMMYVSGLDRATAERHLRWRAATVPGNLAARPVAGGQSTIERAVADGRVSIATDDADRRATVRWSDTEFGAPMIGAAIARPGYGGILLGAQEAPRFEALPLSRTATDIGLAPSRTPPELEGALDTLFANSSGIYGMLIATPERILAERYSAFGAADRATPSWSMTKALTCTLIGRLIQERWFASPYQPAPAPLWRDPRAIQHQITLDHLLRMRSGLGFPVLGDDGEVTLGFENSAVYQDATDAFVAAQRSIVATQPGAVFRYINAGVNVLGSIIRDQIEQRGLPYHQTVYDLLVNRLGMGSYQHSADIAGNFIASGAGFATLRDYAKIGLLYLQNGMWRGERLLPEGWADYALTATHTGTSYAACFRANIDGLFPDLPADTAWASGASDQRIFILRRHGLVATVANETDHPMDLAALNRVLATAIASL